MRTYDFSQGKRGPVVPLPARSASRSAWTPTSWTIFETWWSAPAAATIRHWSTMRCALCRGRAEGNAAAGDPRGIAQGLL